MLWGKGHAFLEQKYLSNVSLGATRKRIAFGEENSILKDNHHFSNDNFITVKVKNIVNFLKHKRIQKMGNLGNWKTSGKSGEILKW